MKTLIVCAGKSENFSFAKSIGVGLVEASIGLSELVLAQKPEKIIFIGTCGLYNKPLKNVLNLANFAEKSLANERDKSLTKKGKKSLTNEKSESNPAIKLLEIYESEHCFNIEASKLTNDFYSPAECEINLNVSYETKKCNSSNFICTDEKIAMKFANLGLELENMESFAVLSVAKHFGISATCFLCATNFCDTKAHEFFLQNHAQAKKNLENFLQEKNLI